jgi:hypothetical protein
VLLLSPRPRLFSSEAIGTAVLVLVGRAGMLAAVLARSFLVKRIDVAKLYHFDSDRDRLFRRMAHSPGDGGRVARDGVDHEVTGGYDHGREQEG